MVNKYLEREVGIPAQFPIKCYKPAPSDIPADAPEVIVGMDSGVNNTAFSYIEVIRDNADNIIDFKYGGTYYFYDELADFPCRLDRQLILAQKYYDLFSRKKVISLSFEALFTDSSKDNETRSGIIATQETTTIISLMAYQLKHRFSPVPAPAIKYCLTGSGKAQKSDMCLNAYAWTRDEALKENDHMADAFSAAFYVYIRMLKEALVYQGTPIPQKFAHMTWNFKSISASGQGSS